MIAFVTRKRGVPSQVIICHFEPARTSESPVIRAQLFAGGYFLQLPWSENRCERTMARDFLMSGMADKSRELRAFAPVLILLAICALINYVDRGNLSIAAPLLKDQLHISASQLGVLLSAFLDLHRVAVCQRLDGGQL